MHVPHIGWHPNHPLAAVIAFIAAVGSGPVMWFEFGGRPRPETLPQQVALSDTTPSTSAAALAIPVAPKDGLASEATASRSLHTAGTLIPHTPSAVHRPRELTAMNDVTREIVYLTPAIIRARPPAIQAATNQADHGDIARPPSVTIDERNDLTREFQLTRVEYFLNGQPLDLDRQQLRGASATFTTPALEGPNILQVRVTALGRAKFGLRYLQSMKFASDASGYFEAKPGDQVRVAVAAYDDNDLAREMKDRLHVKVSAVVTPLSGEQSVEK